MYQTPEKDLASYKLSQNIVNAVSPKNQNQCNNHQQFPIDQSSKNEL